MEAVRLERVSKNFGGLQVLWDISLSVEVGESVAIIGPNGAGKTTLLNLISRDLPVTNGEIYIFGQEITTMPAHHCAHIGLARSFQISRLFYNLTVLDNIILALRGTKRSRYQMFRPATADDGVIAKAEDLLKSVDLWQRKDELMKALSYGEQRKTEVILSLASEPKVLLVDEPTAGLGIDETLNFLKTIKTLAKDVTLIFTEHDMDVVFDLARRVIVLYYGKFIADGTPEEIQANPIVQDIYLGVEDSTSYVTID